MNHSCTIGKLQIKYEITFSLVQVMESGLNLALASPTDIVTDTVSTQISKLFPSTQ